MRNEQSSGLFVSPREILRTGHRSLLPQLRLGGYFYASVRGIAAQATAACGGCREPEQGRGPQRASPAQGALTDPGYPRPVQGVPAGDSRRVNEFSTTISESREQLLPASCCGLLLFYFLASSSATFC